MGNTFVEDSGKLSDEHLVSLIRSGNEACLNELSDRYMPIIVKIAKKKLCAGFELEDLIQEGKISLYSAVRSFSPGAASFHTFAVLCITRGIGTAVRSAGAVKRIPDRLISSIEDNENCVTTPSPEKVYIDKESYFDFAERIRLSLSGLEFKVLNAFLDGKSYSIISSELGISEKSVDNALHRIRKKLKAK